VQLFIGSIIAVIAAAVAHTIAADPVLHIDAGW
jgi:hypothetical protein